MADAPTLKPAPERSSRWEPWAMAALALTLAAAAWHIQELRSLPPFPFNPSGPTHNDRIVVYLRYEPYRLFLSRIVAEFILAWALGGWLLRHRLKTLCKRTRAALVALAVLLFLVGLEASAAFFHTLPFGPDQAYMTDPILGWRMRPIDGVNLEGLRNPPVPLEKEEGELRILCVGDSCTYGHGLSAEASYPARLQAHLQRLLPERKVTVLNAGVPGYNSVHGLVAQRRFLRYQPDLSIWSFASNDTARMPYRPPQDSPNPWVNALRQSHFYYFLRIEVSHRQQTRSGAPEPLTFKPASFYVEQARQDAAAGGCLYSVVTFPDADLHSPVPLPPAAPPFQRSEEALQAKREWLADYERAAREASVPVLSPVEAFQQAPDLLSLFNTDRYHLSSQGGELFGETLARQIVDLDLAPDRPKAP